MLGLLAFVLVLFPLALALLSLLVGVAGVGAENIGLISFRLTIILSGGACLKFGCCLGVFFFPFRCCCCGGWLGVNRGGMPIGAKGGCAPNPTGS